MSGAKNLSCRWRWCRASLWPVVLAVVIVGSVPAAGVRAASDSVAALAVLPVWRDRSGALLWEDANRWRKAWGEAALEIPSGAVVVPAGDVTDAAVVDAARAVTVGYAVVQPLAVRYGARDVLVAEAALHEAADQPVVLNVSLRLVSAAGAQVRQKRFVAATGEDAAALMGRAARELAQSAAQSAGGAPDVAEAAASAIQEVRVVADIASTAEWVEIRQKLEKLPGVKAVILSALSYNRADVVLRFEGEKEALAGQMESGGLQVQSSGADWAVRLH